MAKKPMSVYTVIPYKHSASFYYRLQVPLLTAEVLGLPVRGYIDTQDAGVSPQDRIEKFCEADIVLLYQPVGEVPINNIRGVQSFLPSKVDGDWKWSPSIIVETDDNLFNVSPLNQAFKGLGVNDMDGNQIPLGHEIGMAEGGKKKVLWKDGENGFSLAKNRQALASYRTILESADQVQCSTPHVEASVRAEATPRRIRTFPNLVRFDHYPQVSIAPEPDKVRILWQGGSAHYEDWYPLREQLGRLTEKYPQVHWDIWGCQYPWVNELIPAHRYTYHDWCAYQEYKLRLCMIGHDIALAPLSPNKFNNCRSAIKFYEASVLKKPAAVLAQNTAAYKDEILDEQTGLLYNTPDEFEEKLSRLIEDEMLRKTLGANAKDWISENRDAMKVVPSIVASWEQLREDRKTEQPHVSDAQWEEIVEEDRAQQEAASGTPAEKQEPVDEPVPAIS